MPGALERPICDYGIIGNSRTAALVSTSGSIDWCCLPRFDSDSLFCSLIDPEIGGHFSLAPLGPYHSHHEYIPGTNVLVTKFEPPTGHVELLDCFTVTDEATKRQGLWPDHEILRKIRCMRGTVHMRMVFYPTEKYGLRGKELVHLKQWGVVSRERHEIVALQTDVNPSLIQIVPASAGRCKAIAEFEISADQDFWFSLIFENDEPTVWVPLGQAAEDRLLKTVHYWKLWIGKCKYHGEYEKQVRRSALTLKMLNFAPSGAFVAAPTTSLPEWIGGTRNWDYRFCWLRDASLTVRVLLSLGYEDEARSFGNWLFHSTRLTRKPWKPRLQVLYDVYGESKVPEWTASWLRGYMGSS